MSAGFRSRPVVYGEVLFDRFPDGHAVLGGAPFNVAWNLQAFGLDPLLVTRVGSDDLGDRILSAMDSWGMSTAGVQRDGRRRTGTVEVTILDGEPAFDIAAGRAYDTISADELPELPEGGILYHGSLALREDTARHTLRAVRRASAASAFLDVNLRSPWWTTRVLEDALHHARWVKMNAGELDELAPQDPRGLVDRFDLESLIVTRGSAGSVVFLRGGARMDAGRPAPAAVQDTVGAGDAFSSVAILGLTRGWSWQDILGRAQCFASAVVGLRGAISDDPGFYARFRDDWELG